MPIVQIPEPDELLAILHALYWALLALFLGCAIVGGIYWADTLRNEHRAARKRHFGGV